jgi:hypothetical protein
MEARAMKSVLPSGIEEVHHIRSRIMLQHPKYKHYYIHARPRKPDRRDPEADWHDRERRGPRSDLQWQAVLTPPSHPVDMINYLKKNHLIIVKYAEKYYF